MTWLSGLVLLALLAASAVFSGSETALYSISRLRVEVDARQGRRTARIVRALLADEMALLITILVCNNWVNQLATQRAESLVLGWGVPSAAVEIATALTLGPILWFFGELLPKDLSRRRPHSLLALTAPLILAARWIAWPLERLLWLASTAFARLIGEEPRRWSEVRAREAVVRLIEEGAAAGEIEPAAQDLARNVLALRGKRVRDCMIPWERVHVVEERAEPQSLRAALARSPHTRVPVVAASGGSVRGYLHQLDVLGDGEERSPLAHLREALALSGELSVDRVLFRLRARGQRLAVVGSLERPEGLVTLKDLVEEISGELADW